MTLRPDFLIVGMERSGTLSTSATLNEHPEIACFPNRPFVVSTVEKIAGETHFFNTLASLEPNTGDKFERPLSDYLTKYGKVFADLVPLAQKLPKEKFYQIMLRRYSDYCDEQRGNKKIVGELTPAYVFHLDFIDSFYPGIKKICSIRDPKDKITSWHFSLLLKGRKTEKEITKEFAMDYLEKRIVKEYEALLVYNGSVHCATFEKRFHRAHEVVKDQLEYLEVDDMSDETIARMVRSASFEEMTRRYSKSGSRKRGEEDRQDHVRKGIVGDWKNYIDQKLAKKIDDVAEPLRERVFEKYNVKQ